VAHTVHALQLFSYDTNGGPSSPDFADSGGAGIKVACDGAGASLDPAYLDALFFGNPPGTAGVVFTFPSYSVSQPVFGLFITPSLPLSPCKPPPLRQRRRIAGSGALFVAGALVGLA
jgi:hypothetical protein